MLVVLNVVYVLVAIAMIALILMQRGAGAQAGSGFGAGASATVFGSTGAGNFLSKATKWLAIVFFGISMFMAWHATNTSAPAAAVGSDLGVMGEVPVEAPPAQQVPVQPAIPQATVAPAPAVDAPATDAPPADAAPSDATATEPAGEPEPAPAE
jgi:preprotein translocase subunit SecG